MELKQAIEKRKSIRKFNGRKVSGDELSVILKAGSLAPSGKNGQPWRFITIQKDKTLLNSIADLTVYRDFVKTADCLICVFLDKTQSYNYIKDVQAIGACIQNMLLTITDIGLGACWIGEILNRDTFVRRLLELDNSLDLMAVLAIGGTDGRAYQPSKRMPDTNVLKKL